MNYIVCATINAQGVTDPAAVTLENVRDALPGVGIAGLQEVGNLVRRWSLRNRLARRLIGVHQVTTDPAKAGVAIVWDKSRVVGRGRDLDLGVVPGPHDDMLRRYLISVNLTIDGALNVTAVCGHRPPWRHRHLWPAYDAALRRVVDQALWPVVLFTDNNSTALPRTLRTVLTPYARRIDMVALGKPLKTTRGARGRSQAFDLPGTLSDHKPVAIELEVSGKGGRGDSVAR